MKTLTASLAKLWSLCLLLAFLVSCVALPAAQEPASQSPTAQARAQSAVESAPTDQPAMTEMATPGITLIDALDRTIELPAAPQRIAMAGRGLIMIADAAYLFPEASERIVAIGKTAQWKNDFVPMIDPLYAQKVLLEGEAGPEQIAAVRPDLVILKSMMKEKLGDPVEGLGISVVYVDFENPEQYTRDLAALGKIFQNEARANQVITYFEQKSLQVTEALKDLPDDQKPGVLLLYYSERDGQLAFNVAPLNWIQTLMVKMGGGRPVWETASLEKGWTKVNFEQIAAWDPDQIYIVAYTSDIDAVTAKLKADPQWQALRATQQGHLYGFPVDVYSWDQPDTRWILGLGWLASKLHPERFPDYNVQEQVIEFYQQLYGLERAEIESQLLPMLKGDVQP